MPAKFKPSERVYAKDARGRRINTDNPIKRWKHFYLKQVPKQELFDAINSDRTKPKHRVKYVNELVCRGIKIVWNSKEDS